jgi:ribosome-associated heat shock protein Hsp15
MEPVDTRIDKFLWSVRLYKTRSIASEACRKGRILLNDNTVKSSRFIKVNDIITLKKLPVIYTFRIINIPRSRISARLVTDYIEDLTPEDEKAKTDIKLIPDFGHRLRGSGRPTKKDRRNLDRLNGASKEDY